MGWKSNYLNFETNNLGCSVEFDNKTLWEKKSKSDQTIKSFMIKIKPNYEYII